MKACFVTFSSQLLLDQLGLEHADLLTVYGADINQDGSVTLFLTGEHPSLPLVPEGGVVPEAQIQCKRIESRLVVAAKGGDKTNA